MEKIKVAYVFNSQGIVDASDLDYLIEAGKIIAFERQGKWIMTDEETTRKHPTQPFTPERRARGRRDS